MHTRRNVVAIVALCSLLMTAWLLPEAAASEKAREPVRPLAEMAIGASRIDWQPAGDTGRLVLTVAGPKGLWLRKEFEAGQPAFLSLSDRERFPDGAYTYELRQISGQVQSGHFSIQNGSFVTAPAKPPLRNVTANLTDDELIIQGNACIGGSCTTTDNDFPVLKLKGQNPNILFDDIEDPPSLVSSPVNDWAIRINPSNAAQFSIFDVDGGLTPFSILGGAPDNSLFIRDNGNVGLGTATPSVPLHLQNRSGNTNTNVAVITSSDSQTLVRIFETATTGGIFAIFDSGGNEDIRLSATGTSWLASDGDVGIGTTSPATQLHVRDTGSRGKILAENASATTTSRELLEIKNNGAATFILKDTSVTQRWGVGTSGSSLVIDNQAVAGLEFSFSPTGNLTIAGTLTQGSDRAMKTGIMPVQPEEVLEKLASLPISTWSRKDEDPKVRHLGPMAQDFSAIFGLGEDNRHIAPLDMAGVSMASIQALHGKVAREMAEKDAEIAALRQRLADLEELVSKLAAPQ
jgi:hypothetical protein